MRPILFWIASTTIILLSACQSRQERILNQIDGWIDSNPDSALVLLGQMHAEELDGKREKALYSLLYSQAKDKCYIDETNDSLIRIACDYYSGHGPSGRTLRSWYCLGVVQKNSGNTASAIFSFLNAEQLAIAQNSHHYAGLSERSVAELYYNSYETKKADSYYQRSVSSFDKARESLYADYARLSWAACKSDLREFEFCDSLCTSVLNANTDNENMICEVYEIQALSQILRTPSNPDLAIACFRKTREYSSVYFESAQLSGIAHAYELAGLRDSSDYYLNKAWSYSESALDSAVIRFEASEILSHRGQHKESKRLLEKSFTVQDSLIRIALNESVTGALNDHISQDNKLRKVQSEKRLFALILTIEISALIITILILLVLFSIRKIKKRNQQIKEKEELIAKMTSEVEEYKSYLNDLEQDVIQARQNASISASAISRQLSQRVSLINTLIKQYEEITVRRQKNMKHWERIDSLERQVEDFKEAIEKIHLEDSFLSEIETDVNAAYSDIVTRTRTQFGSSMPEDDYRLLSCALIGLQPKNIAFVMKDTPGSIRTRKSRLLSRLKDSPLWKEISGILPQKQGL